MIFLMESKTVVDKNNLNNKLNKSSRSQIKVDFGNMVFAL